jgi:glutaconyl-CoA/methylmalonyl-CoA decarboxylase subunit gamma
MKKLRITVEGRAFDVTVEELSDDGSVAPESSPAVNASVSQPSTVAKPATAATTTPAAAKPAAPAAKPAAADGKDVVSQVSGMVVSVDVAVGDVVAEAQQLITIEAMKMNTYVMAPFAGTVTEILAAKGKSVLAGDVLVRLS